MARELDHCGDEGMRKEDPGKRHPLWLRFDELTRRRLLKAMREPLDEEGEFLATIWAGSCIHCGSDYTMDLCEVEGIENPTVGLCKECGGMWCTECRAPIVTPDLVCGHFDVCEECGRCLAGRDLLEDEGEDLGEEGEEALEEIPTGDPGVWESDLEEILDLEDLEEEEEEAEEYIDPFECQIIRDWLVEKGFYTREEFEEYDRRCQEEDDYESFCMEAMHFCAWCRKPFDVDGTIFTSRLELKPGLELEGEEGLVVPLHLSSVDRVVPAIFFTLPLPGNRGQRGLNVVTCSLECLEELREAFNREREIIERFNVN